MAAGQRHLRGLMFEIVLRTLICWIVGIPTTLLALWILHLCGIPVRFGPFIFGYLLGTTAFSLLWCSGRVLLRDWHKRKGKGCI